MRKKFVITLWVILFLCISAVSLAFYAIWHGWIGYMPNLYQLENPVNKYASQAVSADGKLLGTWSYSRANRIFVGFDDLSPWLVKALVATEDERFYDHSGIDYRALARAVVKRGLLGQSNAGGGSTITQQLAKNLYFTQEKKMERKVAEVFMAFALERDYSKNEILELYVNTIYFGNGYYCIKDASEGYFGKEPEDLTDYESTLLAGVPNAPSKYSPTVNLELAEKRQEQVVERLVACGLFTKERAQETLAGSEL
jgi:penicillin-binding protein 1A